MNCLENIIGLRGVCEPQEALTYINDCIPLKLWSKLANDEDISGRKFFERVRRKASEQVISDFLDEMPNTDWKGVIGSKTESHFSEELLDCTGIVGRKIISISSDPYITTELVSICISSESEIPDFELTIKTDCSEEIKTVNIVCGKNDIPIGVNGGVEISFDTTGTSFYKLDEKSGCCSNISSCGCASCVKIEDIQCAPFAVCINCICDPTPLICKNRYQLKEALKWMVAACFYEEFEVTCRKNEIARNMVKNARMQYDKIMGGSTSDEFDPISKSNSKYWPKLWAAAKKTSIDNTVCTSCRGSHYRESL